MNPSLVPQREGPGSRDALLSALRPRCQEIEEELVRDFVFRMDPEYFLRFTEAEIAHHLTLAARLSVDQPCAIDIRDLGGHLYGLVIVAFDHFSEFATICGLLAAYGLDIREGSIYTFADASRTRDPQRPPSWPSRSLRRKPSRFTRKKIVDHFLVHPLSDGSWTRESQRRFMEDLHALLHLLEGQKYQEARAWVNRRLVEALSRRGAPSMGLLHPVQIRFDNQASPHDTVVDIRSVDTPAFLYAFSNALTMRGVYIHKARLENIEGQVHDRLYIRDRHGHKITDPSAQHELRITAVLIKQFTQFLTWAPNPGRAIESFDQFLDTLLHRTGHATADRALRFLSSKQTLALLARLFGTSDFLWEDFLRRQHDNLVPLLTSYRRLPLIRPQGHLVRELRKKLASRSSEDQRRRILNAFKDRELFRIDMTHLADSSSSLTDFSRALTELAEVVLQETVRAVLTKLARRYGSPQGRKGSPCPFAVLGMGKFGGRELGYASDIEVLFVYRQAGRTGGRRSIDNSEYFERVAHEILQWIEAKREGIFHLDVRLRPHGSKGQLTNTLDELRAYYGPGGLSAPFERQALIKLRHVAADPKLGHAIEHLRDTIVYSSTPWDLRQALELRQEQIRELVDPGQVNVKYSRGGLIDVEYAVQYLQLMHGHRHPALRTTNTLEALDALSRVGVLRTDEYESLRAAYLFFRTLIDGLRIVRGHAKDLVLPPPGSDASVFLARRVGYASEDWHAGAAQLDRDIARHMSAVARVFAHHFGAL